MRALKRGDEPTHMNKDVVDKLTARIKELERQLATYETADRYGLEEALSEQLWQTNER